MNLCWPKGVTDQDGLAVLPGRKEIERDYNPPRDGREPLMVRVDLAGDMALLPLDQTFLVDLYRASKGTIWSGSDYGNEQNHIHAWGTTAQGVYKLGDTVQYKLYVRDQNNLSLAPVEDKSGFDLNIQDPTGKVVHTESNITLSEFGGYSGSFHVPLAGCGRLVRIQPEEARQGGCNGIPCACSSPTSRRPRSR